MDFRQKYKEEFNKDVFSEDCCMQPTASYSDEYVRWLEKQVKNCSIPHVSHQGKLLFAFEEYWNKNNCDGENFSDVVDRFLANNSG